MAPVTGRGYPRWCYEEKRYPDGRRNRFRARLLLLRPGHGALHFVSDPRLRSGRHPSAARHGNLRLFWEDRPYNLYAWMAPGLTAPRALYFNICDQVTLAAGRFAWRDLWVDVLVTPHGAPRVLDRHEVPAAAPLPVRALIDDGVGRVLADHRTVARYLQALLPALRRAVMPAVGRTPSELSSSDYPRRQLQATGACPPSDRLCNAELSADLTGADELGQQPIVPALVPDPAGNRGRMNLQALGQAHDRQRCRLIPHRARFPDRARDERLRGPFVRLRLAPVFGCPIRLAQ